MHALMAAVLLRLAWLDPFVPDAQSQPPHRELAQSRRRSTSERSSVVGSNRFRQSEFPKSRFKYDPGVFSVGSFDGAAAQQISAVGICDRQWIAPRAISSQKPPFEIRTPNLIGRLGMAQRLSVGWRAFSLPLRVS